MVLCYRSISVPALEGGPPGFPTGFLCPVASWILGKLHALAYMLHEAHLLSQLSFQPHPVRAQAFSIKRTTTFRIGSPSRLLQSPTLPAAATRGFSADSLFPPLAWDVLSHRALLIEEDETANYCCRGFPASRRAPGNG